MSNQPILFQISAAILNFGVNGKCGLSEKSVRDRVIGGQYCTR